MTVDFADHFWGEKNNGFSVLYQNMKHGQASVKELVAFLRERATAEEEYQKRLGLITKQISTYGTVGSFASVWQMVRASLEKVSQLHSHLVQKLQELSKEVQKYGDEQQKKHKEVKDKESKTFDSVNYIQTTTTCLQKSRENYFARCIEHEKLKREGGNNKEIAKSETRMKKAADEYKMYVEKYGNVRDDFEDRMIKAARSFQQVEENHLSQMKLFASAYAQNVQSSYVLASQIYGDFLDQMTALDIDALLEEIIVKRDTGTEKPLFYFFEEPDLCSLAAPSSSLDTAISLPGLETGAGLTAAASSADASPIAGSGVHETAPTAMPDPFDVVPAQQQQKKLSLWLPGRSRKQASSSSSLKTNASGGSTTITPSPSTDLTTGGSLFSGITSSGLDGGKLEGDVEFGTKTATCTSSTHSGTQQSLLCAQSASSYSTAASSTATVASGNGSAGSVTFSSTSSYTLFGSLPLNADDAQGPTAQQKKRERSLSMGFLRKKKEKKKKDKEGDNRSVQSSEDTKSKTSAESTEGNAIASADKEEFSVILEDQRNHVGDKDGKYGSSSDTDSDDDQPQRIKVQIKPLSQTALQKSSASIDELRDAIGSMRCSSSGSTLKGWSSATSRKSGDNLFDPFDPLSRESGSGSLNQSSPWNTEISGQRNDVKLLRPAKTGDDKFNNRFADNFSAITLPRKIDPSPPPPPISDPWPTSDEGRDQLSELSSTSSLVTHGPGGPVGAGGGVTARSRPRSNTPTHMITLANAGVIKKDSTSSRSMLNHSSDATLGQSGLFGPVGNQQLSQSATSSRVPSPLSTVGPLDAVPLAMALTETVHVLFKPATEAKCITKVYGNVAVSFPSNIVHALAASLFSGGGNQRPPLSFRLTNADKIGTLLPNRQVLNQGSTFQASSNHQFECNMPALIAQLKRLVEASPTTPFCNLDLLRYELKSDSAGSNTNNNGGNDQRLLPLMLQSFWKCEADHTDIRIDYQYNHQCTVNAPVLNLTFSSEVNGGVSQVNAKPEANWSSSNNRLSWRLTELSRHGDCTGSLKARLSLTTGPSTPASTTVQFQINEHILSGADLNLTSNNEEGGGAYRLSLLKKKTLSGKYVCEAEVR